MCAAHKFRLVYMLKNNHENMSVGLERNTLLVIIYKYGVRIMYKLIIFSLSCEEIERFIKSIQFLLQNHNICRQI